MLYPLSYGGFPSNCFRMAAWLCVATAAGADFYVATDGNDDHPGTEAQPFATLRRARDAVRQWRAAADADGPVTVHLRGGVYELTETLALTAEDSGTKDAPVVWRNHASERVVLSGGRRIGGFEPVTDQDVLQRLPETARGNVLQTDVRAAGIDGLWRGGCRRQADRTVLQRPADDARPLAQRRFRTHRRCHGRQADQGPRHPGRRHRQVRVCRRPTGALDRRTGRVAVGVLVLGLVRRPATHPVDRPGHAHDRTGTAGSQLRLPERPTLLCLQRAGRTRFAGRMVSGPPARLAVLLASGRRPGIGRVVGAAHADLPEQRLVGHGPRSGARKHAGDGGHDRRRRRGARRRLPDPQRRRRGRGGQRRRESRRDRL
jgi:hypothetical protein